MKVFYHDDADGVTAAALFDYAFRKTGKYDADYIPLNFSKKFFSLDSIKKDEHVVIVDYSIKPSVMDELLKITKNVIWIDHHKSAIEMYKGYTRIIKGLRSTERSAAYLAWIYLIGKNIAPPKVIQYVDDHDRYVHALKGSDEFRQGLWLMSGADPTNALLWDVLFEDDEEEVKTIMKTGEILESNADMWRRKADPYKIEFEGYTFLVLNKPGNSKTFKYVDDGTCEGLMTWFFNGKSYIHTIFQSKLGKKMKIDMSEIATKYGGGGHPGAAGFVTTEPIANKPIK